MIYAVSKRTKIHRRDDGMKNDEEVWAVTDPDGWIPWESEVDECPLPRHHRCRIRLSCGSEFEVGDPEAWDWSKGGDQWIIAYRPMLGADTKPEPCRFHGDDTEACETYSGQVPCEPEPPAWDGESWPPPIGARTRQLGWMGERYGEVLIVGHHNGLPVGCTGPDVDDYQAFIQGELTPIRSEEDRSVEEMAEVIDGFEGISMRQSTAEDLALALYRAGYRKEAP